MKQPELRDRVNTILAMQDDEAQHGYEDDLRIKVIREHCPAWVVAEIERLAAADFERWCA